jgi:hypothetical protein
MYYYEYSTCVSLYSINIVHEIPLYYIILYSLYYIEYRIISYYCPVYFEYRIVLP